MVLVLRSFKFSHWQVWTGVGCFNTPQRTRLKLAHRVMSSCWYLVETHQVLLTPATVHIFKYISLTQSHSLSHISIFFLASSYAEIFDRPVRCYLPAWFRWIGWILSAASCAISAVYTALLCQDFQHARYVLWLQTVFVAFLFCNFVSQPLSVLCKALFMAIRYRKDPTVCFNFVQVVMISPVSYWFYDLCSQVLQHFPDRYEDEIEELRVKYRHMTPEEEMRLGIAARQRSRYLRFARPPQEKQLIAARKQTMKERKLVRLFTEVFVSSLLLTLLLIMVSCK